MGVALMTSVGGIGFTILNKTEPDVTVVTDIQRFKVCVRRTSEWKEVIAEFLHKQDAYDFLKLINRKKRYRHQRSD